jgi:hypothetical protein
MINILHLFRKFSFFALVASLYGCTNLKDLRPDEFNSPEFYKETISLNTSIEQIEEMYPLYVLNNLLGASKFNVADRKARVWWEVGGFAKMATMAMIEFEQPDLNVALVTGKVYAANDLWLSKPKGFLDMLKYRAGG